MKLLKHHNESMTTLNLLVEYLLCKELQKSSEKGEEVNYVQWQRSWIFERNFLLYSTVVAFVVQNETLLIISSYRALINVCVSAWTQKFFEYSGGMEVLWKSVYRNGIAKHLLSKSFEMFAGKTCYQRKYLWVNYN